jgi:hypothetical protein
VDRAVRLKTFDAAVSEFAKIGPRQLKHGTEIFEFTEWLGKGGFGEVFRARRVSDGRDVAVKRLFSSGQSARFVREAKILRNAAHPNLTEYVDFVEVRLREDEREYYLILEYLEGMPGASLRDRIKASESGLDVKEALRIFISYLSCLEHLHQNGIIHRDIKPGNLYAPADHPEKAKIFDLGIAHDEEGTRTHGQVPGTLDYMPPEFAMQSSGRGSAQSDIYSIGVTLYLALTKNLPFPRLPDKEAEAWIAFIKRSTAPLECAFDHPVFAKHPELVPLLRRALAGDPKRRQASAKAMEDEILGILEVWDKRVAFDAAIDAARKELALQNFDDAERHAAKAVALLPKEQSGRQLLMEVRDGRKLAFRAAVIAAREALAARKFEEAARQAQLALNLAPADKEARQLLAKAQEGAASPEPAEDDLDERPTAVTMATAEMAPVAEKPPVVDKTPVVEQAPVVEKAPADERAPADEEATAETRPADLERLIQIEKEAAKAGKEAVKAEKQTVKVERKVEQPAVVAGPKKKAPVGLILGVAAGVVLLVGLYFGWNELSLRHQESERQQAIAMKAERASKYREAMEAGRQAFSQGDFAGAIAQAEAALKVIAGDGEATKLREDAQAKRAAMTSQAERDGKYRDAMEAGRTAFGQGDFATAIVQAESALAMKAGDGDATKLRDDAQARRGQVAAQAALDRKYRDAMEAGRKAFGQGDFVTAIVQAEAALAVKAGDGDATKLRDDAQAKREQAAAQAELDRKYQVAMTAGRFAYDREDYGDRPGGGGAGGQAHR